MDSEKEDDDWGPDDSLAGELGASTSQKDDSFNHDDLQRDKEVLIKPDSDIDLLPSNRTWSPRKDAFIFSKFISFLYVI